MSRPDEKLYELLAGDRDIPWAYAAGEFLRVKVASGGFYPDDAQEICKIIVASSHEEPSEPVKKALEQGTLSGLRSIPAGDISALGRTRRTRASRIGDALGLAGGAGVGLLATRGGSPTTKAVGAVLGALGGKTVGKAVGTEVDAAKIKSRLRDKKAEIEKKAAEEKRKGWTPAKSAITGAALGAGAGAVKGHLQHMGARAGAKERMKEILGKGGAHNLNVDEMVFALRKPEERAEHILRGHTGFGPRGTKIVGALKGLAAGAAAGVGAHHFISRLKERSAQKKKEKSASAVLRIQGILEKMAQHPEADPTITSPITPMPSESRLTTPGPKTPLHPEIEAQLQQLQQQNEADFYSEQAAKAKEEAEAGKQRIEELINQINMLNQHSQSQMQQDQQVRMIAEQNAQMSQQDAVMARDESLQAQQQNLALRNAVTQFRQALMNLVAQDPTTLVGPPAVPTGPGPQPPEAAPPAGPEAGAPPPEGAAPAPEAAPEAGPPAAPPEKGQGAAKKPPAPPKPPASAGGPPELMEPPPPPAGAPAPVAG